MTKDFPGVPRCDEKPIFDLYAAQMQTRVVEICLRIGLFDALREPQTANELRRRLSIGERAVDSLVSVLAALGLVKRPDNAIQLTDLAREYLLRDSPFFKGFIFRFISDKEFEFIRAVHLQDGYPRPDT